MKNEDVEISSLLKSKDFDELNEGEQRFVLSEFGSRHKYDEMREALKDRSRN